jgi:hypothetical protein
LGNPFINRAPSLIKGNLVKIAPILIPLKGAQFVKRKGKKKYQETKIILKMRPELCKKNAKELQQIIFND